MALNFSLQSKSSFKEKGEKKTTRCSSLCHGNTILFLMKSNMYCTRIVILCTVITLGWVLSQFGIVVAKKSLQLQLCTSLFWCFAEKACTSMLLELFLTPSPQSQYTELFPCLYCMVCYHPILKNKWTTLSSGILGSI